MIPHFTKRMEVGNGYVNIYFNRVYTVEGMHFHVSLIERETRKLIMFMMHENEGAWSIINPQIVPDWTRELELQLSEIIQRHQTEEGK
jgi:hypothetical protein